MFVNIGIISAKILTGVMGLYIAYTIIRMMADEILRGVFVFTQFFGYFTIQSGTITALVLLATAFAPIKCWRSAFMDYARGMATLYMFITIIVYHLLESPPGTWVLDSWSPIHVYAPIFMGLMWLGFLRPIRQHLKWWWPLSWMIYPLVFAIGSLVRGSIDGWYPYGFLDVDQNGVISVAVTIVGLVVSVAVIGYALLFLGRLERRKKP